MHSLNIIKAIALKDFLIEYRSKEAINAVVFFSLLVLAISSFALEPGSSAAKELAGGILWIAYSFSAIFSLNRSFSIEKDENAIQSLLLIPGKKSLIYWGKFFTNFVYIFFTEIIIFFPFLILFNIQIGYALLILWAYILLADIGLISIGTLFASMLLKSKTRELMLPILLFPISIPLMLAATKAFSLLLQGAPHFYCIPWLKIILSFDIIYLTACLLLSEYTIGE